MTNKHKYLVTMEDSDAGEYGTGVTLEQALENLESHAGDYDRDYIKFYEITPIEVEFKIVKKEVVKSISKVKGAGDE